MRLQAPDAIEPMTPEELTTVELARQYFWYFLKFIYAKSFEGDTYLHDDGTRRAFEFSQLHLEWAMLAQVNPRLCVMAPRAHLKSTVLGKAFALWHLFRTRPGDLTDIMYFSYKAQLATEQVEQLLRLIQTNPYCRHWKNLKPSSSTQVNYLIDFGLGPIGEGHVRAEGIMSATRGRHPKVTICDDILSDFANPLTGHELQRISRVFRQAIMSLPANPDDPLLVVGTPQSYDDILYELARSEEFLWLMYPAIIDHVNQVTQWPEKFTFSRLNVIRREIGNLAFEVEYQLMPVSTTDQFFTRDDLLPIIDGAMPAWDLSVPLVTDGLGVYGGFDVGRLVHPSHVCVLLELPSGTLVQVYQEFMDHLHYGEQVRRLNHVAESLRLSRGYYDATYNALDDRGLSPKWRGRAFTRKLKADMATLLEKRVHAESDRPSLILLNDARQLRQLLTVDKQLKAATSVEGHGDAFWSLGLAVKAAEDGPGLVSIGSATPPTLSPGRAWAGMMR